MANDVRGYYEGERISTHIVSGIGVAAMGLGVPLVLQEGDFARGLGWPLLILGALQTVGAVLYAFEVSAQMAHYGSALEEDAGSFREEESQHMDTTIDRFIFCQLTEVILTLGGGGLATYGFLSDEQLWQGIGIGVAALALPFLVIDLVNQQRGARYAERVDRVQTETVARTLDLPAWQENTDRLAASGRLSDGFYFSFSHEF